MKKPYKLSCMDWNSRHVRFALYDPFGANCGEISVLSGDVQNFISNSWSGDVLWNGKSPVTEQILVKPK